MVREVGNFSPLYQLQVKTQDAKINSHREPYVKKGTLREKRERKEKKKESKRIIIAQHIP